MGTKNQPGKFDCYSRLEPDEPHFVLMGRDPAAPILINLWADIRSRMGEDQAKIEEACSCAEACVGWLYKLERVEAYKAALAATEEIFANGDNERIKELETENQELLEEVLRLRMLYEHPNVVAIPELQKDGGG